MYVLLRIMEMLLKFSLFARMNFRSELLQKTVLPSGRLKNQTHCSLLLISERGLPGCSTIIWIMNGMGLRKILIMPI